MGGHKRERPAWWLPAADFRRARVWVRRLLLARIEYHGAVVVEDMIGALAAGDGDPPKAYMTLGYDRRRKMIWNTVIALQEERLIEVFRPRGGFYFHLRMVNVLDRMSYALSQEAL